MARKKRQPPEKSGPPGWIVSFSDMVTLLLAFFVLLQSFASVQDPELFFVGQGSFKRAIAGMGLPSWLLGRESKLRREFTNPKHSMDEGKPVKPVPTNQDADGEKIRKMFADLKNQLDTTATDLSQRALRIEPTPIHFDQSACRLDDSARKYLRQLAFDLTQTVRLESVRYYVIGLAADEPSPAGQWVLSARRAHAVEDYLAGLLKAGGTEKDWILYSWGAGPGGPWCQQRGFLPVKTHVVIAVVKESSDNG